MGVLTSYDLGVQKLYTWLNNVLREACLLSSASSRTIWVTSKERFFSPMLPPHPLGSLDTLFIQVDGTSFLPKAQEFVSKFKTMTEYLDLGNKAFFV